MNYFCTLFDKNYLYKGLALHQSLLDHGGDFSLWILAMDDLALKILEKLRLENVQLIRLTDFEDEALLKVKPTRSLVEYYWTISSSLPLYILKNHQLVPMITYLDADVFFFSSPSPIFDELGDRSILLTEHRFPPYLAYKEKESGRFNVQYMTFRRDDTGLTALKWWRERCLEWCFFRYEDGKLGDQLYLNDWPTRWPKVHIARHIGAGVAPWNVLGYRYRVVGNTLFLRQNTQLEQTLIFYHFHGLKLIDPRWMIFGLNYPLPAIVRRRIYHPYIKALQQSIQLVAQIEPLFHEGFSRAPTFRQQLQSLAISQKLRLSSLIYDYQSSAR